MNNYDSFSLLTAYVQQVFNCSTKPNSDGGLMECPHMESRQLLQMHRPSPHIVPLVKAVYAVALAIRRIEADSSLRALW